MIRVVVLVLLLVAACADSDQRAAPTTTMRSEPFFVASPEIDRTVPVATVSVFFVDTDADPPELVEVLRQVPDTDLPRNAALALMAGPTPDEGDDGLALLSSGATGISGVAVTDGVATVELSGECEPEPGRHTLRDLLVATLTSLPGVATVTVLGPGTASCLEAPPA